MSLDDNKALYRRYIDEAFNGGRVELLDQFLAPSYVFHDAPPGVPPGIEGVRQTIRMFHAAFPDLSITIEELVAEGDTVCTRAVTRGTHTGAPIMLYESDLTPESLALLRANGFAQVRRFDDGRARAVIVYRRSVTSAYGISDRARR